MKLEVHREAKVTAEGILAEAHKYAQRALERKKQTISSTGSSAWNSALRATYHARQLESWLANMNSKLPAALRPSAGAIRIFQIKAVVQIAPRYLPAGKDRKQLLDGLRAHADTLLNRFHPDLGGAPMTYGIIRYGAKTSQINAEFPFLPMPMTLQCLVFAPRKGDFLVGKVNRVSSTHIGIVVHQFNFSIMPENCEALNLECEQHAWKSDEMVIKVGSQVRFQAMHDWSKKQSRYDQSGSMNLPGKTGAIDYLLEETTGIPQSVARASRASRSARRVGASGSRMRTAAAGKSSASRSRPTERKGGSADRTAKSASKSPVKKPKGSISSKNASKSPVRKSVSVEKKIVAVEKEAKKSKKRKADKDAVEAKPKKEKKAKKAKKSKKSADVADVGAD